MKDQGHACRSRSHWVDKFLPGQSPSSLRSCSEKVLGPLATKTSDI